MRTFSIIAIAAALATPVAALQVDSMTETGPELSELSSEERNNTFAELSVDERENTFAELSVEERNSHVG
jgi:hypothetical protein